MSLLIGTGLPQDSRCPRAPTSTPAPSVPTGLHLREECIGKGENSLSLANVCDEHKEQANAEDIANELHGALC